MLLSVTYIMTIASDIVIVDSNNSWEEDVGWLDDDVLCLLYK